jgi:hypothetical protein
MGPERVQRESYYIQYEVNRLKIYSVHRSGYLLLPKKNDSARGRPAGPEHSS